MVPDKKRLLLPAAVVLLGAALLRLYTGPVPFLPKEDAAAIRFKRRATLGLIVPDADLGHALKARHERTFHWKGFDYATRQTPFPGQERLGYRDPSPGDGGRADIAAVGDSFTLGMEVDAAKAWPSVLSRLSGLRVVNLGAPSYGTTQEALLYREYGRRLRPRLILLLLVTNDPRDNVIFSEWRRERDAGTLPSGEEGDFVHYKFCRSLGLRAGTACRGAKLITTRFGAAVSLLFTELATVWMNLSRLGSQSDAGMDILIDDLGSLRRDSAASGGRLAVLLHPNWSDRRWGRWHPGAAARLRAALEVERIPFLDLSESMSRKASGTRTNILLDGHWNEKGHALAAAATLRFLRENGLVAASVPLRGDADEKRKLPMKRRLAPGTSVPPWGGR